jgi:anhydro-N-acetylmuramic acid kinase
MTSTDGEPTTLRVAGMMSGTSFDAVDVAVADFAVDPADPQTVRFRPIGMTSREIDPTMRSRIGAVLPPQPTTIEEVCRLDTELGQLFAAAAAAAADRYGPVDLVVSHGQTVFHWVRDRHALGTLQLGNPAWIAEATGAPVLSDIRNRDIARGGQGAPLAAILDALLVLSGEPDATTSSTPRRGSLNLGGIANITVSEVGTDGRRRVLAYDLGPAGALLDLSVSRATNGVTRMDIDGRHAASGQVDTALLRRLLDEPYFDLDPPKSTGKELFDARFLDAALAGGEPPDLGDLLATLTELTATLVADACRRHRLTELVVAGGGIRNPTLMSRISAMAEGVAVRPSSDFGLPPQAKEAYLMALLGFLSWHGIPGTLASATGASSLLGSFTPGSRPLQLPTPRGVTPTRMIITT